MKAFFKSLYWLLTGIFYGLLPLGIIFILKLVDSSIPYNIDNIINEGILIFFSVAISASVMVDYIFVPKKLPKWIEFVLYGFPWGLVLISSIVYSQLVLNDFTNSNLNLNNLILLEFFVLGMTLVYVLIVKTIIFLSSKMSY